MAKHVSKRPFLSHFVELCAVKQNPQSVPETTWFCWHWVSSRYPSRRRRSCGTVCLTQLWDRMLDLSNLSRKRTTFRRRTAFPQETSGPVLTVRIPSWNTLCEQMRKRMLRGGVSSGRQNTSHISVVVTTSFFFRTSIKCLHTVRLVYMKRVHTHTLCARTSLR